MPLMRFPDPIGWMYAAREEVKALVERGWVESSEKERQDMIAAKRPKVAEAPDEEAPKKRGKESI